MNKDMISELYSIGLIPVIKIENPDDAVPLAKALIDGGLPAAEITFRTKCAAEAIKNITDAYKPFVFEKDGITEIVNNKYEIDVIFITGGYMEEETKHDLIKIIVSAIFLGVAIFIEHKLGLPMWANLLIYLVYYTHIYHFQIIQKQLQHLLYLILSHMFD